MRFVWAVAAFVLAAVMIGAGIAQRTVFQGPSTQTTPISIEEDAPFVLIDGAVLNSMPGLQTLRASGDGSIFVAYGRTADLEAWLADSDYNAVDVKRNGEIATTHVEPDAADAGATDPTAAPTTEPTAEPATPAPTDDAAGAADADAAEPGRSPIGSDLWLDEFQQDDVLIAPLELPETMSVLVAADGTAPAPSVITVSWPLANSTPWSGPLIVAGGILMAAGITLYLLGIRHARRSRGPRRKGLPLPVTEPIDLAVEGEGKGVISASAPTRRAVSGRRSLIVIPAVAVSALLFTGCAADAWPDLAGTPTPTPSASVIVPEGQQAPAVTETQAERIIERISTTVAEADEKLDADLAATRIDGAVLAERATNYRLRSAIADYAAPAPIETTPLSIVLPQAVDGWPRTVMAVVTDDENKTANIMLMTQQDQWADYKLTYLSSLEAATEMPKLAPAYIGATQVNPDSQFLLMAPEDLAAAYSDVINHGDASEYAGLFTAEGDQFRAGVAADRAKRLADFNATGAKTGSMTFASSPGAEVPLALATLESGAIVAINLNEIDTVKPTVEGAAIRVGDNPTVKTLAAAAESVKGFTTTWNDQLFFYVPSQGSTEKIRLLGYASEILDAKVIS